MLVHRDDLAIANSRLQTGFITLNQLAGPPLGAALFAVGMALAVRGPGGAGRCSARCWSRGWRCRTHARDPETRALRHDIAEGFRWVGTTPPSAPWC